MAAESADPAWSAAFTDEDWERLDSIVIDTEVEWAGRGFTVRCEDDIT